MLFGKYKKNECNGIMYTDEEQNNFELSAQNLKTILSGSEDISFRDIKINNIRLSLIYVNGLVDHAVTSDYILKPLNQEEAFKSVKNEREVLALIEEGKIYYSSQYIRSDINIVISDILSGSTVLVLDKEKKAIIFDAKSFEKRSISEPTTENVIKGAKDSFVETLQINTATIRRRIRTQNLVIEKTIVGKQTLTNIAIIYMKGVTNRHILDEVKKRLSNINIDGVISTGFIEEYIIDNNNSPFPQVISTERPDKFCAGIISGMVGIIIDGIPVSYQVPGVLNQFLQAPEDYSQNYIISTLVRVLRYSLMLVTLFLPGFYVSIVTFHQEMIPTSLALSIAAAKEGVPFPSFIEVILMLIAFEILIEAGLRLPKTIGQAVSIVGALVVGEAAVNAKFISPAVVLIIAVTAISNYTMPNQDFSNALRIWRLVLVVLSSIIGLFGLSIGSLVLLYHLSKIESYGVPYLSPFVADENRQMQDSLFRLKLRTHIKRPIQLKTINKKRQD
ncbi:spore germination protein [Petroclostridium sp. X23]|uniref:spore germination protein n=1 Tax=Petroclostridium sp. X23 TaxID=3045146 RepID=UPI0024ADC087|nr:spore germination protein [Petroclostridium sp. X23]WHH57826.1 spore germination protein [Petroclostridium sp. X23]